MTHQPGDPPSHTNSSTSHANSQTSSDLHIHRIPHNDHFHTLQHRSAHTVEHGVRSHGKKHSHVPHHHNHDDHRQHHTRKHLISRPYAKSYFDEEGDLHKLCDLGIPTVAGRLELFLDLLYIGLCANLAGDMIHHPRSGVHLLKYIVIFIPAWRIWIDLTALMNQYFVDDLYQRLLVCWCMILMMIYGNNAPSVDISLQALQISAGCYILARASISLTNLFYSTSVHHHRTQLRFHSLLTLAFLPLSTPLFIPTISLPAKATLTLLLLLLDILTRHLTTLPIFRRLLSLPYSPAIDIDHTIDRMSVFYLIVLGEFLYNLVEGSHAALSFMKSVRAVLSLVIAFELFWLYVAADGSPENREAGVHALRWRGRNGAMWFAAHLPLSAALLISGDICAVFVAYGEDSAGLKPYSSYSSDIETGHHKRAEGSGTYPLPDDFPALRWLFCGGLSIGVACLYFICLLHHEADEDEETKCMFVFPMLIRRCLRPFVAVILACLPLAGERLTITEMMGICCALLGGCVVWEMMGGLDREWEWVGYAGGRRTKEEDGGEGGHGGCGVEGCRSGSTLVSDGVSPGEEKGNEMECMQCGTGDEKEGAAVVEETAVPRDRERRRGSIKPGEKGCETLKFCGGEALGM